MSSDYCFEDISLDPAALERLDVLCDTQILSQELPGPSGDTSSSNGLDPLGFDESKLNRPDGFIESAYKGTVAPYIVSGNNMQSTSRSVQTTLFGDVLGARGSVARERPTRSVFGRQARKTKSWDHTEFAKTGWKKKGKRKDLPLFAEDQSDRDDEENVEFEQFPAPQVSVGPPSPMMHKADPLEAKHWIFPLNQPKRDYQFNIVKHCLFDNTLVSLPTGLGKTFIAGCVMLNFYRWFPSAKVVFVAPTKPLVSQQIDACHKVCGIPGSHAVELTGQNPRAMRSRAWAEKKVFYMTPQTLINDLTTENCDARDIILLVIDEAHKGTGDYAYAQVVRYLMAKNPHFRILALTATPGSSPDAVQEIVDALHISRIEIRDEGSLDLKDYIHRKNVKQHVIHMTGDIEKVQGILSRLIDATMKPLRENGIMYGNTNPAHMSAFLPQAIMRKLDKNQRWACAPLARLSSLARAMGYLVEGTMSMFDTYLQEIADDTNQEGDEKKNYRAAKLRANPIFQSLLKEVETQRNRGFGLHPKMEMLKTLVVQHFGQRMAEGNGDAGEEDETRVMVFVTFRSVVEEIVQALDSERPLIRATKFIGQGTDKQGNKGFAQKEQLEVIKQFKAGVFNVLVATSIGEEGLDIGEIDMIVCYDTQKTPIRMLQRLGRTGRRREGYVHVLLAEGREETNMDKAKATYKDVQRTIVRGEQLELYGDVERLLPDHLRPECLEKVMDIEEYVREEARKRAGATGKFPSGKKRTRDENIQRNIPPGASKGFVSVLDLLSKVRDRAKLSEVNGEDDLQRKHKKQRVTEFDEFTAEDDDVDAEIEDGMNVLRRAASAKEDTSRLKALPAVNKKGKLTKAASTGISKPKLKSSEKARHSPQLHQAREPVSNQPAFNQSISSLKLEEDKRAVQCPPSVVSNAELEIIDITSESDSSTHSSHWNQPSPRSCVSERMMSATKAGKASPTNREDDASRQPVSPTTGNREDNMAWLVDDDDEPDIILLSSSPARPRKVAHLDPAAESTPSEIEIVSSVVSATNIRSDHDSDGPADLASPVSGKTVYSEDPSMSTHSDSKQRHGNPPPGSDDAACSTRSSGPRLPPLGIAHPMEEDQISSPPVRLAGRQLKKRGSFKADQSFSQDMPPPSQWRLQRMHSPPSGRPTDHTRPRNIFDPAKANPWLDLEAVHSGDESSEGSSSDEGLESETDMHFMQPLPETQISPSYDQSLAYRQSLMTQPPNPGNVPAFGNKPVRRGRFGVNRSGQRVMLSSSPVHDENEPNEYEFGSFVVEDEAEVSYAEPSSGL